MRDIFHNYVLTASVAAWLLAQMLKVVIEFLYSKKLNLERLVGAGGMPSSHSAGVCALTISLSRSEGVKSPVFALAFVLACIVMYDAMSVRREAGEHAKIINKMVRDLDEDSDDDMKDSEKADEDTELKEILGHTPLEVLAGACLGILVALIVPR